ncbi:MAG: hypothetical protein JXA21_09090 [Anaerolineae bacterium]|nr:hypothetical protein [Anaerolineae bacterium]
MRTSKILSGFSALGLAFGLLILAVAVPAQAKSILDPGDIAIIGYNFDNPDEFAFVALVELDAGAEIRFTDSGWTAAGAFRGNEGAVKYTAPAGGIVTGTIVVYTGTIGDFSVDNDAIVGTSGFSLSGSGDQILAFQGLSSAPNFVYGLHSNTLSWELDATDAASSTLPSTLTNGTTAVAIPEVDNAVYTGTTFANQSHNAAYFLSLIGNPANWQTSDSTRFTMPSTTFTGPNAVALQNLFASSPLFNLTAMLIVAAGLVILRKRR